MKIFFMSFLVGGSLLIASFSLNATDEALENEIPAASGMPMGGVPEAAPTDGMPMTSTTPTPEQVAPQEISKPIQVAWPQTTAIAEDTKDIVAAEGAGSSITLFEQAQTLCKNIDDTIIILNTQRDTAHNRMIQVTESFDALLLKKTKKI